MIDTSIWLHIKSATCAIGHHALGMLKRSEYGVWVCENKLELQALQCRETRTPTDVCNHVEHKSTTLFSSLAEDLVTKLLGDTELQRLDLVQLVVRCEVMLWRFADHATKSFANFPEPRRGNFIIHLFILRTLADGNRRSTYSLHHDLFFINYNILIQQCAIKASTITTVAHGYPRLSLGRHAPKLKHSRTRSCGAKTPISKPFRDTFISPSILFCRLSIPPTPSIRASFPLPFSFFPFSYFPSFCSDNNNTPPNNHIRVRNHRFTLSAGRSLPIFYSIINISSI